MAAGHTINWVNPVSRADGTAYTQAQNAGYTLAFDGNNTVSVPLAWGTSFDMSTTSAFEALTVGSHTVSIASVDTGGLQSAFSTVVTFSVLPKSPPLAPTGVVVV